jgi:hypothetical protein
LQEAAMSIALTLAQSSSRRPPRYAQSPVRVNTRGLAEFELIAAGVRVNGQLSNGVRVNRAITNGVRVNRSLASGVRVNRAPDLTSGVRVNCALS